MCVCSCDASYECVCVCIRRAQGVAWASFSLFKQKDGKLTLNGGKHKVQLYKPPMGQPGFQAKDLAGAEVCVQAHCVQPLLCNRVSVYGGCHSPYPRFFCACEWTLDQVRTPHLCHFLSLCLLPVLTKSTLESRVSSILAVHALHTCWRCTCVFCTPAQVQRRPISLERPP